MADVLPIATVVAVVGKAFARDTDGNLRSLKPGDVLREGDTVITAAGDRVELALENGEPLFVQPNQTVQMTAELSDLTKPDASESAVASAEVDRVIQTLEQGGDLNAELDAPAAGLAGGTGGDGNSFVRLLRIVESTEPLAFEFGTARGDIELPFNGLVGDNQDLPTAVPDTAQTERDHQRAGRRRLGQTGHWGSFLATGLGSAAKRCTTGSRSAASSSRRNTAATRCSRSSTTVDGITVVGYLPPKAIMVRMAGS